MARLFSRKGYEIAAEASLVTSLPQATLLRLFCTMQLKGAWISLALCLTSAALAVAFVPALHVLAWLSLVIGSLYLMQRNARRMLALAACDLDAPLWSLRLATIAAAQSVAISLLILLPADISRSAQTFLIGTLMMLSCLMSLRALTLPLAFHATLAPTSVTVAAFLLSTQGMEGLPSILMLVAAYVCLTLFTTQQREVMEETFAVQADQQALYAQLQSAFERADDARRRAEEASLAKSKFLATMSHELRTPLNAILGFSEVMKNELFGAHVVKTYKDYASDIHASGEHLLNLINEVLDLSRVEAGRYELHEEAISLAQVVQECHHLMEMRAKERDLALELAIEPTLPELWADARALRQVTLNLISNAIKFTPPGGRVDVAVGWTAKGGAYLAVRDTGPGIPQNEIPLVLSSFGRGSNAQKSEEAGSGLGLPIAKSLIELHGGRFAIHSQEGHGTQVVAAFPPDRLLQQNKSLAA